MDTVTGELMPHTRTRLYDLSPRAYEHPADRAALVALRAVPGFDIVLRKLIGLLGERSLRLIHLGSAVRVGPGQFGELHKLYQDCLHTLDFTEEPELYVAQTPFVNAGAVGTERPFIVLNSGAIQLFTPEELRVILGHELGHILSGHVLYKTMLHMLLRISIVASGIPVATWTLMAIIAALKEWDRKSELSCDRAGLLASQDLAACYRVQMKMACGSVKDASIDEFMKQAEEYEAGGDMLDSVFKVLNIVDRSHPFPVLRLAELKRWVDRGEYDRILRGDYARRSADSEASIFEELKASARSYKETAEETRDPMTSFFRDLGASVSARGKDLWGRMRSKEDESPGKD